MLRTNIWALSVPTLTPWRKLPPQALTPALDARYADWGDKNQPGCFVRLPAIVDDLLKKEIIARAGAGFDASNPDHVADISTIASALMSHPTQEAALAELDAIAPGGQREGLFKTTFDNASGKMRLHGDLAVFAALASALVASESHWVDASDSSPTSSNSLPATPPDVYAGTIPELPTHRGLGAFQVPPGKPSCDTWRLLDYELCVPFLRNESLRNESSHESSFTAVRSCTDLHAAPKCMHWSHDDASSTLPASRYWLTASWRP